MFTREPEDVVGMRRMMEITLFIKLYQPSHGSPFTLLSTYLQIKSSKYPLYNPQSVIVRASHIDRINYLYSHTEVVCHNAKRASCHCHGLHWAWTIQREGHSTWPEMPHNKPAPKDREVFCFSTCGKST